MSSGPISIAAATLNIYCDESRHLERDRQPLMVLGALWMPADATKVVSANIRDRKKAFGLAADFEVKWTKVSPGRLDFYKSLVDYFFDDPNLHLRAVVATGKSNLDHATFQQTHDDWYYKMYYTLLIQLVRPGSLYRIYLDIKDTRGGPKTQRLREILSHAIHDFKLTAIERLQIVRSEEIGALQLLDLLIGAIGYLNCGSHDSAAKVQLAEHISARAARSLDQTTPLSEDKMNLLVWTPQKA